MSKISSGERGEVRRRSFKQQSWHSTDESATFTFNFKQHFSQTFLFRNSSQSTMEAEERPSKMRKLSHEHNLQSPGGLEAANDAKQSQENTLDAPEANGSLPESTNPHGEADSIQHPKDTPENQDEADGLPAPAELAPLADSGEVDGLPVSKNQLKKLRKKQEWESKREERKIVRKEKIVAKRERKRAARQQELGEAAKTHGPSAPPKPKQPPPRKSVQVPVTILIDCDFDDLMRDNERISLASQITRCYSDTHKSPFRPHMAICSFTGKLRERFDNILSHYKGWKGVHFLESDFVDASDSARNWMTDPVQGGKIAGALDVDNGLTPEIIEKMKQEGEVVYLSSEASDTLTELKPYSTYIIGGLVDKNREKGICYKRATQRGVRTAKLPIGEYLQMSSRKVLATNHVNEIMVKWLESGDWGDAFMKVIPKRKGGKLKGDEEEDEGENIAEAEEQGQSSTPHEADQIPTPTLTPDASAAVGGAE